MKIIFETQLTMEELAEQLGKDMCPSHLGIIGHNVCDEAKVLWYKPVLCKDCWKAALQEEKDGEENSDQ